jgi:hypothetical protein
MDWETIKENFQPLTSGRDPKQLAKAQAQPPGKLESRVEEQRRWLNAESQPGSPFPVHILFVISAKLFGTRRHFWKQISEYQGSDPLELWLRYVLDK